ncbi:LysR family transcriptional regulator [Pelagovum pacificum]|uniref:LysR family transcriptional regulator n=1 Tax=Pelagovum pacificum TaxID=2588711 RepID=A0A5C5GD44_9RHOB|nr:LysR family transcriptional regulator [Pelagovum pacificum]QQA41284.1 LysR family transcriptional regulator [Pelagovum pacificum]TNY31909.1 LysR family transcriptional regulator [Pelagovum pacificum]
MDRLDRLELFTRIVEAGSFARAARDLNVARSTATNAINLLERETGVRLLARTTRHVAPTPEGEAFYIKARDILAEVEETFGAFGSASPTGHLRIDASGLLTRTFLVPHLPAFLEEYPGLTIAFSQSDRFSNIVQDGVDCALRVGELDDSSLRRRRLGELPEITCASPDYLARHGTPRDVDALAGHRMVGFLSSRTGDVMPLEFVHQGTVHRRHIECVVSTDNSDTAAELARQGLGLIQAPQYRFAADLASGALVEVLGDCRPEPMPLNAIHSADRRVSLRLKVFLDWVSALFAESRVQID